LYNKNKKYLDIEFVYKRYKNKDTKTKIQKQRYKNKDTKIFFIVFVYIDIDIYVLYSA